MRFIIAKSSRPVACSGLVGRIGVHFDFAADRTITNDDHRTAASSTAPVNTNNTAGLLFPD